MDARVKGAAGIVVVHVGGGCWGRATVAAATTTVTLRCAGRNRRTVSGRELPRTLIASRDRIVLIEGPPAGRGGRPAQLWGRVRRRPPGGWVGRSRRPRGTRRVRGR